MNKDIIGLMINAVFKSIQKGIISAIVYNKLVYELKGMQVEVDIDTLPYQTQQQCLS